jgi:hypothetical protein
MTIWIAFPNKINTKKMKIYRTEPMKNQDLPDQILPVIRSILDDRQKMEKMHEFLLKEISDEPTEQESNIP